MCESSMNRVSIYEQPSNSYPYPWRQPELFSFIVDPRINETLQTGAVGNRTYRVGESVYLFLEFTIVYLEKGQDHEKHPPYPSQFAW